jgi:hypothetical protein
VKIPKIGKERKGKERNLCKKLRGKRSKQDQAERKRIRAISSEGKRGKQDQASEEKNFFVLHIQMHGPLYQLT